MIALNIDAWKILVILNVIFSFAVICYSLGEPAFDRGTSILKHRRLLATCSRPFFQAGRSGCSARWVGCQHLWGRSAGALSRRLPLLIRSTFWGPCQERNVRRFCGASLGLARQSTCHMGAAILLQLSVKKCRPVWWLLMSEQILIVQQRSTTVPTIWLT